jgi:hypothetical protein
MTYFYCATGIEPFDRLVQQVMEQEPYRKAQRVLPAQISVN